MHNWPKSAQSSVFENITGVAGDLPPSPLLMASSIFNNNNHSANNSSPEVIDNSNANAAQIIANLWLKIDQQHLNYLKAEDGTKKLDIRSKLEGYVHAYLSQVPQDRKFCNPLTNQVLFESAKGIPHFSALKAAQAFEAIEVYAANLLNQPWRKEFKQIKLYGGFYKHKIESALHGAERLFELMGYQPRPGGSLTLGDHIDQDQVTTVARDCILAAGECAIIMSIFHVVSASYPCTWDEVMSFRANHVGSGEQARNAIMYAKSQKQYRAMASHQGVDRSQSSELPSSHSGDFRSATSHSMNSFSPSYPPAVGQLIDYDTNHTLQKATPSPHPQHQDESRIPLTIKHLEEEHKRKSALLDQKNESWDYVYNQLQQIGYTKDASERPDVLDLVSKVNRARAAQGNPRHVDPELATRMHQLDIHHNDEANGYNDETDAVHRRLQKNSGSNSGTLKKTEAMKSKGDDHRSKSLRHSRPLEPPKPKSNKDLDLTWECFACTFANSVSSPICDMCGKSRNSPDLHKTLTTPQSLPSEAQSLEDEPDGGLACQKCTLVNPVGTQICDACGTSLPTKSP